MVGIMRLGVVIPQTEIGPDPARVVELAVAAEQAGFDHLLAYDHVLGADITGRTNWPGPYTVEHQFHEVMTLFAHLAACCSLELVTGVLVLPQRQTALVAKQAAQIDLLTRGRFRLGVGIGWNPVEYEALGCGFEDRAARYEEQIEVIRLLTSEAVVRFEGRWHRIDGAGIRPLGVNRPVQVWLGGGTSRRVLERIGRIADGWVCNTPPGHGLEAALPRIRAAAASAGRDPDLIGLQGIAQPGAEAWQERLCRQADRWRRAGATHLAISGLNAGRDPSEHMAFVNEAATVLAEAGFFESRTR
jgi:probable F420-dependent oxidoreductase